MIIFKDIKDHVVAPLISKSKGLRSLKAEIMKSNPVFEGNTKTSV